MLEGWVSSILVAERGARRATFVGRWRELAAFGLGEWELRIVKILVIWESRALDMENLTFRKSNNKS